MARLPAGARTERPGEPTFRPLQVGQAGDQHTCAIRADGTAACWGTDATGGQVSAPPGRYVALSSGGDTTCAIKPNSTLSCWGADNGGPGESTIRDLPGNKFRRRSQLCDCQHRHAGVLGRRRLRPVLTAKRRDHRRRRRARSHVRHQDQRQSRVLGLEQRRPSHAASGTFVAISAGGDTTCGVRTNGKLACWGAIGYVH